VGDDVQMAGVVARVFAITVVPLAIGMAIRSRHERWAVEHEGVVKRIALIAFHLVWPERSRRSSRRSARTSPSSPWPR